MEKELNYTVHIHSQFDMVKVLRS